MLAILLLAILRCGAVGSLPAHQVDEEVPVWYALQFLGGDLNPHWFDYHTLPMYLLAAVYATVYALLTVTGAVHSLEEFASLLFSNEALFYVTGRVWMSFMYTAGCAVLAWILWRRWRAPGVAGIFFAATFLLPDALVASNQIKAEAAVFLFMTGMLWFGFLAARTGRTLLIAAVFLAAAVDSKIPALTLAPVLAAQAGVDLWARRYSWRWVAGAVGVFLVALFVFMPYAFLDSAAYRNTLTRMTERVAGESQHLGKAHRNGISEKTGAVVHELDSGAGTLPLVACVALVGLAAVRRRKLLLPLALPAAYAAAFVTSRTLDGYWLRPVFPLVLFFSAVFLLEIFALPGVRLRLEAWAVRAPEPLRSRLIPAGATLLAVALLIPPFSGNLRQVPAALRPLPPDNRVLAGNWVRANIPPSLPILLDGAVPQYHPRIPAQNPFVYLAILGYGSPMDREVGSTTLPWLGYADYYQKWVVTGLRWSVLPMIAEDYGFNLDRLHVPQGTYVVLTSYYARRFDTDEVARTFPEIALRAQAYYRRIRSQEKVAEFASGSGPKIEIWRMTEAWPPADITHPFQSSPQTVRPATPG
ncbi:MAG: hypothetical protein OEW11_03715 [Nitrospirota bacterium]|nr:hypothetical protein [Nitrospirota bacterium]